MTGLTESERDLIRRALALAGRDRYSAAVLADAQCSLTDMVRLAERLGGRIAHLARQLERRGQPSGMTEVERFAYRALHRRVDELQFRLELELARDEPVAYVLTPAAVTLLDGGGETAAAAS